MTRDKDRKRIIRNRMSKTGESYTGARRRFSRNPFANGTRRPISPHSQA
jgi:hypothetical protein